MHEEVSDMNALPAAKALDGFFFDARARILDLAAFLDRLERGENAEAVHNDPRLDKIRRALGALLESGDSRAEQVQKIFSLDYDSNWERPKPRY
jgi:hypothetical protein